MVAVASVAIVGSARFARLSESISASTASAALAGLAESISASAIGAGLAALSGRGAAVSVSARIVSIIRGSVTGASCFAALAIARFAAGLARLAAAEHLETRHGHLRRRGTLTSSTSNCRIGGPCGRQRSRHHTKQLRGKRRQRSRRSRSSRRRTRNERRRGAGLVRPGRNERRWCLRGGLGGNEGGGCDEGDELHDWCCCWLIIGEREMMMLSMK
mmetsp:Transcript_22418/g.39485  ORF Transcript_22418/g.39485 Transcript_22418/m.39485 type:complete len:216 (+) Transcript_22418:196-843(+)